MRKFAAALGVLALAVAALLSAPSAEAHHKPGHRGTTTTLPPTTAPPPTTTTTTTPPPDPVGIDPDGGNGPGQPYTATGRHLPNDPNYFPLAVFLENVHDCCPGQLGSDKIADLQSHGINTLYALTGDSNLDSVEASGMKFIAQVNDGGFVERASHPSIDGWLLYDEPDLMYGPGSDAWSGNYGWNTCIPIQDQGGKCGYTVLNEMKSRIPPADMDVVNFGLFMFDAPDWPFFAYSDAECSNFVNGWGDIVSMDYYGFTHPSGNDYTNRGVFYGKQVDRIQACDGMSGGTAPTDRKPVWSVVELGAPFTDGGQITPPEMRSATWHSIIAGARGVLYFNHSFGGTCRTFSILRDPCSLNVTVSSAVTALNQQITGLAPVLNADFAPGVTSSSNLEAMAKLGSDGTYVFAGANWGTSGGSQSGTVDIGSTNGTAEVLFENRTVPVVDGVITDTFADANAVHIYRVS